MASPWYFDRKGYLWQRLRNGRWASTDGLKGAKGDMPPEEWAPYTEVPKPVPS